MYPLLTTGSVRPSRRLVLGAMLALAAAAPGCIAPAPLPPAAPAPANPIPTVLEVRDPRLLPALHLLLERSPRVGLALEPLAHRHARIRVHTYDSAPGAPWLGRAFAYGYTQPFYDRAGGIDSIDVAIQWTPLHSAAAALGLDPAQLELEIAVLLGHELFGHAVPLLEHGTAAGECHDISAAGESCSLPRENLVRADLGVGPRPDYVFLCLAVTRLRDEGAAITRERGRLRCGPAA